MNPMDETKDSPVELVSVSFAGLFAWSPGDDHAVPWPFLRLLCEPTLDSKWSIGNGAAPVDLDRIGAMDVGLSLIARAICGSRGPGALIICSTMPLLGRV